MNDENLWLNMTVHAMDQIKAETKDYLESMAVNDPESLRELFRKCLAGDIRGADEKFICLLAGIAIYDMRQDSGGTEARFGR